MQVLASSVNFMLVIHKVTKQSAAEFPAVGIFMEETNNETLNTFQFPNECTLRSGQAEKS